MKTRVRSHQWVMHAIVPVEVLPSLEDGSPDIMIDEEKLKAAKDYAVYGCFACSAPLDGSALGTPCPGEDADLSSP